MTAFGFFSVITGILAVSFILFGNNSDELEEEELREEASMIHFIALISVPILLGG